MVKILNKSNSKSHKGIPNKSGDAHSVNTCGICGYSVFATTSYGKDEIENHIRQHNKKNRLSSLHYWQYEAVEIYGGENPNYQ